MLTAMSSRAIWITDNFSTINVKKLIKEKVGFLSVNDDDAYSMHQAHGQLYAVFFYFFVSRSLGPVSFCLTLKQRSRV